MRKQQLPKTLMTELAETSIAWHDAIKAIEQEENRAIKAKRLYECQCLERRVMVVQKLCAEYRAAK